MSIKLYELVNKYYYFQIYLKYLILLPLTENNKSRKKSVIMLEDAHLHVFIDKDEKFVLFNKS
jgi:hypothetical protein